MGRASTLVGGDLVNLQVEGEEVFSSGRFT